MQILSTNIAQPVTIKWRGQNVTTGIYKQPTQSPIFLGKEDVSGDEVSDRKVHGGIFKACYLFSSDQYPYWQHLYPHLDWTYGMLGENLTVSGLDETQIHIGDLYKVGNALIKITQPREPCFKFGVKFGTQKVLQQFIARGRPGTYVSVIEEGFVEAGNEFQLLERPENSLTTAQLFNLLFSKEKDHELLKIAINNDALPQSKRIKLAAFLKK